MAASDSTDFVYLAFQCPGIETACFVSKIQSAPLVVVFDVTPSNFLEVKFLYILTVNGDFFFAQIIKLSFIVAMMPRNVQEIIMLTSLEAFKVSH